MCGWNTDGVGGEVGMERVLIGIGIVGGEFVGDFRQDDIEETMTTPNFVLNTSSY